MIASAFTVIFAITAMMLIAGLNRWTATCSRSYNALMIINSATMINSAILALIAYGFGI